MVSSRTQLINIRVRERSYFACSDFFYRQTVNVSVKHPSAEALGEAKGGN